MCRLDAAPLASAAAWLRFYEDHWQARMDDLEAVLRAGTDEEGTHA